MNLRLTLGTGFRRYDVGANRISPLDGLAEGPGEDTFL